jgi:hypothetical protein
VLEEMRNTPSDMEALRIAAVGDVTATRSDTARSLTARSASIPLKNFERIQRRTSRFAIGAVAAEAIRWSCYGFAVRLVGRLFKIARRNLAEQRVPLRSAILPLRARTISHSTPTRWPDKTPISRIAATAAELLGLP